MADRTVCRNHIGTGQHRAGEVGHHGAMRPEITSLVEPEFVVEAENEPAIVHRGAYPMDRASRLVRRDQMLVTVLDPFDRPAEPQRRRAGQHIFGIKLAANAEPAADVPFVEVDPIERQPEHRRQRLAIVMRHLGGAIQPKNATRRFGHRNRAAGFERYATVPTDGQLQRN
jgi:hypothetical protein